MSDPCCITDPIVNQNALLRLIEFSSSSGSWMQGCGLSHSWGATLEGHPIANEGRDRQGWAWGK
ncbi:hypothetical protein E2C01_067634 [Portunus trituberculatus]|uniref:Uncharacterized protein n=1 Tax=Portunus trituberculatus TaxID=210409 RepID=A0A5B7HLJ5_PORTR|nr:hypothetical protein [Portunus trituberculatus]